MEYKYKNHNLILKV